MKRINAGFSALNIILMVVIVILAALAAFLWLRYGNEEQEAIVITSFEECVDAGYPIMESDPRRCSVEGHTFTDQAAPDTDTDIDTNGTGLIEHSSDKGVVMLLRDLSENDLITSPLEISGQVRGSWSFEASFPIELRTTSGNVIARTTAQLQDDWMTEDNVPFIATLEFDVPAGTNSGELVFLRDNPSGLPENADEITVPVRFQ